MNLLNLDPKARDAFVSTLDALVNKHGYSVDELFVNVLESETEADMNYWMTRVLVEEHELDPQKPLAQDAAGEDVKPLQAASLLQNAGVLAALLELNAFVGSVVDREFQLAARIASKHEDQAMLALLMKYAQERGELDWMLRTLKNSPLQ